MLLYICTNFNPSDEWNLAGASIIPLGNGFIIRTYVTECKNCTFMFRDNDIIPKTDKNIFLSITEFQPQTRYSKMHKLYYKKNCSQSELAKLKLKSEWSTTLEVF